MAISIPLSEYLRQTHIEYDVLKHKPTTNAMDTAYNAHIPMECLAKAVVLEDDQGNYLIAAVPAHRRLNLPLLRERFQRNYNLAEEHTLKRLFRDCQLGALPALGQPYQLETICDHKLLQQPHVYIEGGDHQALLKFKREEFQRLMANSLQDQVSTSNALN